MGFLSLRILAQAVGFRGGGVGLVGFRLGEGLLPFGIGAGGFGFRFGLAGECDVGLGGGALGVGDHFQTVGLGLRGNARCVGFASNANGVGLCGGAVVFGAQSGFCFAALLGFRLCPAPCGAICVGPGGGLAVTRGLTFAGEHRLVHFLDGDDAGIFGHLHGFARHGADGLGSRLTLQVALGVFEADHGLLIGLGGVLRSAGPTCDLHRIARFE